MKKSATNHTTLPHIATRSTHPMLRVIPPPLNGSPLASLLRDQVNRLDRNETRRSEAAAKVQQNEKCFINSQAHFYNVILRRRQQRQREVQRSTARSMLASSMEKYEHRARVETNAYQTKVKQQQQAHAHLDSRLVKIANSGIFRQTKRTVLSAKHSNASSSQIIENKSQLELKFSMETWDVLEHKQQHAASNLSQQTERRRMKSRQQAIKLARAKSKHQLNCEAQQGKKLSKCVSTFEKQSYCQQRLNREEMGLICDKLKSRKQQLNRAKDIRVRQEGLRKQKILQEINHSKVRLVEAEQKRQKLKEFQGEFRKLSRVRMTEVLKRSRAAQQSVDIRRQSEAEKKAKRYRQIAMYKQECERIKQASRLRMPR